MQDPLPPHDHTGDDQYRRQKTENHPQDFNAMAERPTEVQSNDLRDIVLDGQRGNTGIDQGFRE